SPDDPGRGERFMARRLSPGRWPRGFSTWRNGGDRNRIRATRESSTPGFWSVVLTSSSSTRPSSMRKEAVSPTTPGLSAGPKGRKRIEDDCSRVSASSQAVRIFEEDRVAVESKIDDRALLDLIPQSVRRLRVIEIGSADYCPGGGTHLKNVSEIGTVHILEKRYKGKETDRIVYEILAG